MHTCRGKPCSYFNWRGSAVKWITSIRWKFLVWLNDHTSLCWAELVSAGNDGLLKNFLAVRRDDGGSISDALDHYKGCGTSPEGKGCYCGKFPGTTPEVAL